MKRWWAMAGAVGAAVVVGGVGGCGSLGYYGLSIQGHFSLLSNARPVRDWLADPDTPAPLRERLILAEAVRDFAVHELKLPDNASYRRYADLKRPAAVWNVVAAPELDLRLKTWCFVIVGCVGYRGYFDRPTADIEAAELRAQGYEVAVYPVPAYSTLGRIPGAYFSDPLLSTFIRYPEADLARLIFHELAHRWPMRRATHCSTSRLLPPWSALACAAGLPPTRATLCVWSTSAWSPAAKISAH